MDLATAVRDYRSFCRSKRISEQTWRWYEQKLRAFRHWAEAEGITEVEQLEARHIWAFVEHLQDSAGFDQGRTRKRSSYTNKGYVQVIKGFLSWAEEEELVDPKVRRKVKLPSVSKRVIRVLTEEQVDALLEAADRDMFPWMVTRDKAIVSLLLDTGIRAAELCGLQRADVALESEDPYILVHGKGDKELEVGPLRGDTVRLIRRYLRQCPRKHDTLFLGRTFTPLTTSGLDQVLYRLRDWAGLEGVEVRAHVFRHTFAVNYMRKVGDIKRLSLLLGHSSVVVTENYLRDFQQREARKGARQHNK